MRLWAKTVSVLFGVLALGIGAASLYYGLLLPRAAPASKDSVKLTPDRLARGKYIFEVVSDCGGCHSPSFGGPVLPGAAGKGQVLPLVGLPGRIVASNITPDLETGIGAWSDGEKIRAIREGVARDGRALFPMMPYSYYRAMSDSDVESLVAYLDTLAPVRNKLPSTEVAFPVSFLIRSAPQPAGHVTAPPREASKAYGEYLVNIGGCAECHTQEHNGTLKDDMRLGGGREFKTTLGIVISSNISPDPDTGIGSWTESYFIQRFRLQQHTGEAAPEAGPQRFTLMPWRALSQMEEQDLSAIYQYLQSQPTIRNKVITTHPAQLERTAAPASTL